MNIFNNNNSVKLSMEESNLLNDNYNNCADIFVSATANKENIKSEHIPLNWKQELDTDSNKENLRTDFIPIYLNNGTAQAQQQQVKQESPTDNSNKDSQGEESPKDNINKDSQGEESLTYNKNNDSTESAAATTNAANDVEPKRELKIKTDVIPLNWNTQSEDEPALHSASIELYPSTEQLKTEECDENEQEIKGNWFCSENQYQQNYASEQNDVKPKLKLNWSFVECKEGNKNPELPTAAQPPRAYNYQEVYQGKKERALRQREEEERKAREFHSRPVPNFKALHKQLENMKVVHTITVPITPETVKHSLADQERRKRREQQEAQNDEMRKHKLESRPFHLRAEQRVRERREYDASVQQNMAQKKKEKDEQRKQQELEQQRELRKMTEFKARPNPFK